MPNYNDTYDTMSRDRFDRRERRDDERGGFFGWSNDDRSRYSEPNETRGFARDRERDSGWFGMNDQERGYGPDQRRRGIPRDETERLIASDKVEGTPVYGHDREKLGTIHNFMVEKRSGKARYAVMKTSSGFLGLDERYYPVSWDELTYDTRVDGYHIDMTQDDLEKRRSFDSRGRPMGIDSDRRDYGETRSYRRDYEDRQRYGW